MLDPATSGNENKHNKNIVSPQSDASGRDRPSTTMHVASDFDAELAEKEASSEKALACRTSCPVAGRCDKLRVEKAGTLPAMAVERVSRVEFRTSPEVREYTPEVCRENFDWFNGRKVKIMHLRSAEPKQKAFSATASTHALMIALLGARELEESIRRDANEPIIENVEDIECVGIWTNQTPRFEMEINSRIQSLNMYMPDISANG